MFPFTKTYRLLKKNIDLLKDTHYHKIKITINKSFINISDLDLSQIDPRTITYLIEQYLNHCFDLLGSGWEENSYSGIPPGMEGYIYPPKIIIERFDTKGEWLKHILITNHLKASQKIWQQIRFPYKPIDWQKDIKSGFRWNAKKWYKDQRKKYYPGADLKMPWEIARFYHLVQMALFSLIKKEKKDILIREFHNQVLDFISTNPPRMGINWTTTMEVSIRSVNMLIAFDLFNQIDNNNILDDNFKCIFSRSIFEHGLHIMQNLEYNKKLTSNHYLSNLAALLFIGAYLSDTKKTRKWIRFALNEISKEIFKQFLPDGVNFESSTTYHALSSSFVLYTTALMFGMYHRIHLSHDFFYVKPLLEKILNFPSSENILFQKKISTFSEHIKRLFETGMFLFSLTKKNGEIPQIGDNDSGRFIKLTPVGKFMSTHEAKNKYLHLKNHKLPGSLFWDENVLIYTNLLSAYSGLYDYQEFLQYGNMYPLEKSFIESLAKKWKIIVPGQDKKNIALEIPHWHINDFPPYHEYYEILSENSSISLKKGLKQIAFPKANIYIFKSTRLFLTVNGMSNGQNGNGGHAHNDKLSFELAIDGKDIIVDPGSYVYTSLPEKRNLFRSTKVHNTLVVPSEEQNRFGSSIPDLFHLSNDSSCRLILLKEDKIGMELSFRQIKQIRIITILDDKITINDYCNRPFFSHFNYFSYYSNGYGKLINQEDDY